MARSARIALVLLIVVTLMAAAVSADPNAGTKPRQREIATSPLIDLFARFWNPLASLWTKNGCGADPSGLCKAGTGSATAKNGCQVDPSGHCKPGTGSATVTVDNGCQVDPDGRCGK